MKRLYIILIAAYLFTLSGCSGIYANYREIEQLQVIETLGFDELGQELRLSVSTGKSVGGGAPTRMTAAAESIHQAAALLQDYSTSEELYYAHSRYILLSESAAADARRYLDYVERSVQSRLDVPLLVVRGGSARELVMETGDDEYDVTQALSSLERDAKRRGDAHFFTCGEVAESLAKNGAALCACVRTEKVAPVSGDKGVTALPSGFAILKDGELAGFLNAEVGHGVTLLRGELNAGSVVLPGGVTVEFSGGDAKLKPNWAEDGSLNSLDVELSLKASVLELNKPIDLSDPNTLSLLGTLLSREAAGWVRTVLEKSVELGADFMGLGHELAIGHPRKWEAVADSWTETLSSLPIRITAKSEILRSYDVTDPLNVEGEEG